jgi:CHAT domain-containing protein/Tfp pilus assembly protein PilF
LVKLEEALTILEGVIDPPLEIRILRSAAEVARNGGQFSKALEFDNKALELARVNDRRRDHAGILRDIAVIYSRQENLTQAQNFSLKALQASESNSDLNGKAEALLVSEDIYYRGGDLAQAVNSASQALVIWSKLGYKRGQARALWDLAAIYNDQTEFQLAFDSAERAWKLFDSLGDDLEKARCSALIGLILNTIGKKQEALNRFEQAMPIFKRSRDFSAEAMVLNSIAQTRADLSDYESALPFAKLALEIYTTSDDRVAKAFSLWSVGSFYMATGDLDNAQKSLESALKMSINSNKRVAAACWRDLGVVLQRRGDLDQAQRSLDEALKLSRNPVDRRLQASVLLAVGRLREAMRDQDAALQLYRESLELHRSIEDTVGQITALFHIAKLLRLQRPNESLRSSEEAIQIIERMRTSIAGSTLRTSYFASAREHFDLYIDLLMRDHRESSAFEFSERARGRTLLESIAETRISVSEGVDRKIAERVTSLRAAIDSTSEKYRELLSSQPNAKQRNELNDELHRLEAELDLAEGQLRTRNPRYADLAKPELLTLQEVQRQILDGESILLEYVLGDQSSYLWAVTRDTFDSYSLPRESEVETHVREFLKLVTTPNAGRFHSQPMSSTSDSDWQAKYLRAAADLSRILLSPVKDHLGKRRIIIVADGALQYLPFSALPTPKSIESPTPVALVAEHTIVVQPSASTLAVLRKERSSRRAPANTIAVLADPVYERTDSRCARSSVCALPAAPLLSGPGPAGVPTANTPLLRGNDSAGTSLSRLAATAREASGIQALVPAREFFEARGFKATREAAMSSDVARARIIHFAAHTRLDDVHPDLSSLVFSLIDERGNKQNGYLRLGDMYNLKLSAELVVLSACETALGKEVKGEGLMSMVRGFMYAGTPRVLASLWKVDDEATADLMAEFYKELLVNKLPAADALRRAQITQMGKKNHESPYYWAGFQLNGEWN